MKIDSILIAKMAGVSQATVSRTFSNPDKVSEKTRKRILDISETLEYKPDCNASALRRKGTGRILLLYIKHDQEQYWANKKRNYWIFAEAILTLTRFFEDKPYIFEVKQINSLDSIKPKDLKKNCDGVIVFNYVGLKSSKYIKEWNIPYILCHRSINLTGYNFSATNNKTGGHLQGSYLKEKGCKKPVYIMNEEDPFSHNLRKKGFLNHYPKCKVINYSDINIITEKLIELIENNKIDSISFVNDMLLVQIVSKMFYNKYDLQTNFPLVGYDNSTELLVLEKKPATIDIGISAIYQSAAEALLNLIKKDIDKINIIHEPILIKDL